MKERPIRKVDKKESSVKLLPSEKYKARYVWLNVLPDDLWLKVRQGETVREALRGADITLEGDCGGVGKCGKCKVKVLSPTSYPTTEERGLLDDDELKQGIRLACRTKIRKDTVVYVGEAAPEFEDYHQILKTGERPIFQLNPLVDQRLIALTAEQGNNELSVLDRIKLGLGPEYKDLKASLSCLRKLPYMLQETPSRGAVVLHENYLMDWQSQQEAGHGYGVVFDLGTSTLVGKLVSLLDGSEVAITCCLNSQNRHGSDVISRLQYVREHKNGLDNLHNLIIRDMNGIITHLLELGGLKPDDIFVVTVAGNTTMQHLLLGVSPAGIAEAPFSPVLIDGLVVKATEVGLRTHAEAFLYVMPVKSGYIGGDLLSFVLASGAAEQEDEIILGLDLGTNGEIFLGNGKRMMTCSAAAGPAFEGARIQHGMNARSGAIEMVRFEDGQLRYQTIGNILPKGICGSGLVDIVAALLSSGVINQEGLIHRTRKSMSRSLNSRVVKRSGARAFMVASAEESYHHKPIYLTQRDIRQLQLAKGAIAAGTRTLMDEMGIDVQDINRLYLAGAMGNYINPSSAILIGLIPRVNPEIIQSLGNAASTGASMILLSKVYWRRANELAHFIEYVELSSRLDFNLYFIEHMSFPS